MIKKWREEEEETDGWVGERFGFGGLLFIIWVRLLVACPQSPTSTFCTSGNDRRFNWGIFGGKRNLH
jgi:hypothetical protein